MRLNSLDVMRGSVMLLLTVVQPLILSLAACASKLGAPLPAWITQSFTHVAWEGMALWDLVMPTFIFMCGAAIPFAVPKYLTASGRPGTAFWVHLLKRVGLLWFLGLILQGNLLLCRWEQLYLFTNTLQAIAVGYAATSLAFLIPVRRIRFALPFVLMGLYAAALALHGGYAPKDNLAYLVEEFCLPSPRGDAKYTWILTSLMFAAMTMTGSLCGELLKEGESWRKKALRLGLFGMGLLVLGALTAFVVPVIKSIYTVSFTALAMGIAVLVLTALFAVIDGFGVSFGCGVVTRFGRSALAAYFIHEFLYYPTLRPLGRRLAGGAAERLAEWTSVNAGALVSFAGDCAVAALFIWIVYLWAAAARARKQP